MNQGTGKADGSSGVRVVDFNEARQQRMEEKRRQTERIFFKNLLGVYSVVAQSKILPIEIIDVSEEGLAFQLPHDPERQWPNQVKDIPIRLYFSQDTYLEIQVHIQNSRPAIENHNRYVRYGCTVDKELKSYPAYQSFIRFLKNYAEHSHKDLGGMTIFYL
jgi:hypothetical protein